MRKPYRLYDNYDDAEFLGSFETMEEVKKACRQRDLETDGEWVPVLLYKKRCGNKIRVYRKLDLLRGERMSKQTYDLSFRCYFPGQGNYCTHHQTMPLTDVKKWIEAYRFTHPDVQSITVKIWFNEGEAEA